MVSDNFPTRGSSLVIPVDDTRDQPIDRNWDGMCLMVRLKAVIQASTEVSISK